MFRHVTNTLDAPPKIAQAAIVTRKQSVTPVWLGARVSLWPRSFYAKGVRASRAQPGLHCDDLMGKYAEQLAFFSSEVDRIVSRSRLEKEGEERDRTIVALDQRATATATNCPRTAANRNDLR